MNKIYLLFGFCAILYGAYFYGINITKAKCQARIATENLQTFQYFQQQNNTIKRNNHEIVYKTGVGDIRRILRDKYTIAE